MNNDDQTNNPFAQFINAQIGAEALEHIVIPFDQIDYASGPAVSSISIRFYDNLQERLSNIDPTMRAQILEAMDKQLQLRLEYTQLESMRLESMRATYGDAFVANAEEYARTQGVSFSQAIAVLRLRDMYERQYAVLRESFERVQAFLASSNVQAIVQVFERILSDIEKTETSNNERCNRRERRKAKHSKPMKETDQLWKQRDYRNRRKR